MRVTPPIEVTASILTSISVPEAAPSAYAGGTTYGLGEQASVAGTGTVIEVYESLQDANTGNAPASSPDWWRHLGTTYAAWNSGTTYAEDDIVLDATTHTEYTSLVGSNLNNNPASDDGSNWFAETSNRYRMFDLYRNTPTTAPSPVTAVLTPRQRIDTVAAVGLVADRVVITATVDGETLYSQDIDLNDRRTTTWSGYFFNQFVNRQAVARFDLPLSASAVIAATFSRASGDVTVGGLVIGRSQYLGVAQQEAVSDTKNTSTVTREIDGTATMVKRRTIPATQQVVWIKKTDIPRIVQLRAQLDAVVALWSALDDDSDGYFEALLILGFFTKWTIGADFPEDARQQLELEEV
jgi:hypothetical protein